MELSLWVDRYYRSRLTAETSKHTILCDEQSRQYMFQIQELQDQLAKLSKDKQRKDSFFYEIVKDNRKLRRQNNKLLVRLKYENDSNYCLK